MTRTWVLQGEAAQERFGARLGAHLKPGLVGHLRGAIGAGKTTLVRGLLRGQGVAEAVTSPTFTLVEPYSGTHGPIYHFDLYRLADPDELHFIGAEDYFSDDALCLLEWAEQAGAVLPGPDLTLALAYRDAGSRTLTATAHSGAGEAVLLAVTEEGDAAHDT